MDNLTTIERDALKAICMGAAVEPHVTEIRKLEEKEMISLVVIPTIQGLHVLLDAPVALKPEEAVQMVAA